MFLGTKPYMAPEILATHLGHINGYDCRVDWWSLAITFFELHRGLQPYKFTSSSTPSQMLQIITNEAFLIPSHWSSDLISFFKQLMHLDIQKRITSLGAFRKHRYMERIDFECVLAR
jgi:serine/threonine kinase 32